MTKVSSLVWSFIALVSLLGLSQGEEVLLLTQHSSKAFKGFKPDTVKAQPIPSRAPVPPSQAHTRKNVVSRTMPDELSRKLEAERLQPFLSAPYFEKTLWSSLTRKGLQAIHTEGYLGRVGLEKPLFQKKCTNLCQRNSNRRCRHMRRTSSHMQCPFGTLLGFWPVPTCCFYWHCLSLYRPLELPRSWWKFTRIRSMIPSSCMS